MADPKDQDPPDEPGARRQFGPPADEPAEEKEPSSSSSRSSRSSGSHSD